MSAIPARKSLIVWANQTFHYRFEWLVKEGSIEPQDLTDWTAKWEIIPVGSSTPWKRFFYPPPEILPSGVVLNGELGYIDLILGLTDVELIPWKQAVFKLSLVDPVSKETKMLLTGRLTTATL